VGASRLWWKRFVEKVSFEPGVCISACTEQNNVARARGNGYVDDKQALDDDDDDDDVNWSIVD